MRNNFTPTPEQRQHFVDKLLPTIRKIARRRWRPSYGDPRDFEANVVALAWKGYFACLRNGNDRYTAHTLGEYALKQVRSGRTVHQDSDRSVQGAKGRKRGLRVSLRGALEQYVDPRQDPSEIVAYRLDVPAWIKSLSRPLRRTARAIIRAGRDARGLDIARGLGISPGRLSQRRRELLESWKRYTA